VRLLTFYFHFNESDFTKRMKLFALVFFAVTLAANVESKYYKLINLNGRCLNGNANWWSSELYQSDCGIHTIPWSYNTPNESQDRHICDGKKCIASPQNSAGNAWLIRWGWLNEAGQRFTLKMTHTIPAISALSTITENAFR